MTAKQLSVMFEGLKIPAPEMEEMINKHVENERDKFIKMICEN